MANSTTPKKRLVASFRNLPSELQEAIKQKYPLGFSEAMMRIDKPNGEFFYAVPFETDEINYLVKIDVKIDDRADDDEDKDYYDAISKAPTICRTKTIRATTRTGMTCSFRNGNCFPIHQ